MQRRIVISSAVWALLLILALVALAMAAAAPPRAARGTQPAMGMAQGLPSNAHVVTGGKVMIDGKAVTTPAPPVEIGRAVWVPGQAVLKDLGLKPVWDQATGHLTAITTKGQMVFIAGDKNASIGRTREKLKNAPFVYENELYVPLDTVGKMLGVKTNWDSKRKEAMIDTRGRKTAGVPIAGAGLPKGARVVTGGTIMVNGTKLMSMAPPVEVGKTVMVPAQPVFQELNAKPKWNAQQGMLTANVAGRAIDLKKGDKTARVAGKSQKLAQAPFVYENELYVPLDFVGKTFNAKTNWQANRKEVVISTAGRKVG